VPDVADIKEAVTRGIQRNAVLDADRITIETSDHGTVVLSGYVSSWAARREAVDAAWSAPGVTNVSDYININYG
jgi:osmotically-inducible protein OsmY